MIYKKEFQDIGIESFRLPVRGKIEKIIIMNSSGENRKYNLKINDNQYIKNFRYGINQDNFIKDSLDFDENTLFEVEIIKVDNEITEIDTPTYKIYFIYSISNLDFSREVIQ